MGSVFSGVGAVINKKPNEKLGKVLLKGIVQGALGGYLIYESKILVGKISKREKLEYGWPAKFVNSAGISIIENAASNRNFWEQWNLNLGFNRIEFHTNDTFRVRYKIMPAAFLLTAYNAVQNKFEGNISLKTGEFAFSSNDNFEKNQYGKAIGTSFLLNKDLGTNYKVISHEIIHIYQYWDFNVLNTYINKPLKEFEEGSQFFKKANIIFHYDFNYVFSTWLYRLENFNLETPLERSKNNFFEHEAYYYSGFL